jgi:hypothetical protein
MQKIVFFLLLLIAAPQIVASSEKNFLAANRARRLASQLKRMLKDPGACNYCHQNYTAEDEELCPDCLEARESHMESAAQKRHRGGPAEYDDDKARYIDVVRQDGTSEKKDTSGVDADDEGGETTATADAHSEEGESAAPKKGGEVLPMPAPGAALPVVATAAPSAHSLVAAAAPGRRDTAKTGTILRCPHACPFTTELAYNLTSHLECHYKERLDANPGYVMCTKPGCGFITAKCRMAPHEKLPHPPAAQ